MLRSRAKSNNKRDKPIGIVNMRSIYLLPYFLLIEMPIKVDIDITEVRYIIEYNKSSGLSPPMPASFITEGPKLCIILKPVKFCRKCKVTVTKVIHEYSPVNSSLYRSS